MISGQIGKDKTKYVNLINTILKHSVPLFSRRIAGIALSGGTPDTRPDQTSTPEQRNKNINLYKCFISSNPQPVDYSHTL